MKNLLMLLTLTIVNLTLGSSALATCETVEISEETERILKQLPREHFMISEVNDIKISRPEEVDGFGYIVQARFVQVDFDNGKGERSYNRNTQMMFDKNCNFLPKNSAPLY